jgi:hypothetical protein
MSDAVSSRHELKMVANGVPVFRARTWINSHGAAFSAAYPPRFVNNIYFDTASLDCLHDHLAGLSQRRKLRCRWYGEAVVTKGYSVEIKQKSGRLGWKEIQRIDRPLDLRTRDWSETMHFLRRQANGTFRALLSMSMPSLINCYRREYYVSADGETRLTLDSDLKAYNQLFCQYPNFHSQIMPHLDAVVFEVKARGDNPDLSGIMAGFPLRAERYSKYVHAMGMV